MKEEKSARLYKAKERAVLSTAGKKRVVAFCVCYVKKVRSSSLRGESETNNVCSELSKHYCLGLGFITVEDWNVMLLCAVLALIDDVALWSSWCYGLKSSCDMVVLSLLYVLQTLSPRTWGTRY